MSTYAFSEISSILVSLVDLVESSLFRNSPTYGSPYWPIRGYLKAQHLEVSSILVSLVDLVESSLFRNSHTYGSTHRPTHGYLNNQQRILSIKFYTSFVLKIWKRVDFSEILLCSLSVRRQFFVSYNAQVHILKCQLTCARQRGAKRRPLSATEFGFPLHGFILFFCFCVTRSNTQPN